MTDAYKTIWLDYGKDWFNARLTGNETCVEYIRADLARPVTVAADTIDAQAATIKALVEALELADAALSGANMNIAVVERKVSAVLAAARVV